MASVALQDGDKPVFCIVGLLNKNNNLMQKGPSHTPPKLVVIFLRIKDIWIIYRGEATTSDCIENDYYSWLRE